MKAILTSSLGGYSKINGVRVPEPLPQTNGLLDRLKAIWPEHARVLFICAEPDHYEKTIIFLPAFRRHFP